MSKVLVFIEASEAGIKSSSLELLSSARASGRGVVAFGFGSRLAELGGSLKKEGVDEAYIGSDKAFDLYNSEMFAAAATEIIEKVKPSLVLASSSALGKDLFPRVAARLKSSVASDCTELKIGSDLQVRRPFYAGKCSAEVQFKSGTPFVLMRANQLTITPASAPKETVMHTVAANSSGLKTLIKEVVRGTSGKLDLTEANIIVSGGRVLRDAEGFKVILPLAEVLGATVGASRAVVDAGWVSHSIQVGQTGKTVAPTLYIACGISGAIQHLAGMSASKVIVAINKDANAPIFQKATYGLVGDAFEIVPLLTEEFKKLLQH